MNFFYKRDFKILVSCKHTRNERVSKIVRLEKERAGKIITNVDEIKKWKKMFAINDNNPRNFTIGKFKSNQEIGYQIAKGALVVQNQQRKGSFWVAKTRNCSQKS